MPIRINDTNITPAPLVTLSKNYIRDVSNGAIGAEYNITLNGTLIAYKGNPESSGSAPFVSFSDSGIYNDSNADNDPLNTSLVPENYLNAIILKQEHLRNLFSAEPLKVDITGFNQESGINAYCLLDSIEFDDQSRWTSVCGYTVNLKTSKLLNSANADLFNENSTEDGFTYYISEASNSWSISEGDTYTASTGDITEQNKLYNVTHSVSAVGQRTYDSGVLVNPISQASGYVHNVIQLGEGQLPGNFLNIPSNYVAYNRTLSETINPFTGSYQIEESLLFGPSGQLATEVVQLNIQNDLSPFTRVDINGTITGFNTSGVQESKVDKYSNALSYWQSVSGEIYNRANSFIDTFALNTVPLSTAIGKNPQEGTISYSYNFDNRPAYAISGALTEDIQISDTYPGQIINVVPVIGRTQPIIQYLNSRSDYKRSLQISAVMPMSGGIPVKPSVSNLTDIFNTYKPVASSVYYGSPTESWNPRTGQYSYNIEWTFEGP